MIGTRFLTGHGSDAERDTAIDLFEESLAHPDLSAADVEMGRYMCGSLLMLRALPGHQEMLSTGTLDVNSAFAMLTHLQGAASAQAQRDLDLAATRIQQLIDSPVVQPQIHQVAPAILSNINQVSSLLGFGGSGGDLDLNATMQVLNQAMDAVPPGAPGHDEMLAMRTGMLAQRFGTPSGGGPIVNAMNGLIERQSGVQLVLPALVQEFARLTGEISDTGTSEDLARVARLTERDADGGLPDSTMLLLIDATLAALAYRPAAPTDRLVELANTVLGSVARDDAVSKGKDHLLVALALAMRGYWARQPDDLRNAVGHLRESVLLLPSGHPVTPAALSLLGVLLDDRYVLGGPAAERTTARQLVELTGSVLDAHRATAATDRQRLAVVRALWCLGQVAQAIQSADRAGLSTAVAALHEALGWVPEVYPWRARLAGGLGLAYLVLGATGGGSELARGTGILVDAVRALPVHHSARSGLTALAGLAALLPARTGDLAAAARAVELLDGNTDVGHHVLIDRTVLLAARGCAHLILAAGNGAGAAADLGIRYLAEARDRSAARPVYLAYPVLRELATAYRQRADAGYGDHQQAVRTGLAALRSAATAVPMEAGADRRAALARTASAFALTVVDWCVADQWLDGAAEAVELARALTVLGATTVTDVVERLYDAGQPDLAGEWRRATPGPLVPSALRELFDLSPPTALYRRVREALGTPVLRVPEVPDVAAALRTVGADLLCYLLPGVHGQPGRLISVSAAEQVTVTSAPGLTTTPDALVGRWLSGASSASGTEQGLRAVCDWAWPAVIEPLLAGTTSLVGGTTSVERNKPGRVVLVPHGTLGRVPWHAARTGAAPTGGYRYACAELVLSYASSAGHLVKVAQREPLPVTRSPVFLVNPMGDDSRAAYAVLTLRRLLYPRSTGLGRTGDSGDRPGTADTVAAVLPNRDSTGVSMLHLACRAVLAGPPSGPWWELAGRQPGDPPTTLPASLLLRHPSASRTGGLVILYVDSTDTLGEGYDIALTPPTVLLAAGATGVVGSGWVGGYPAHPALVVMVHHFLADQRMSPTDAVASAHRWMLDPRRQIPPYLKSSISVDADLTDVVHWATFRYQGR
ncbi:hypothetical protein [Micromonospora sp. NBC_01796]|uniref:hypothetical protein n=1 Tax=Micromonospora sp. NBC_01796 TaxID=2975987 RepID=UPI002DD869BA|nr:hypothetical protein [Micromonospora sp. NBC_01796]WSA87930.1 CHAT domain-containing protein [Micromonospora sp. NBC_01796]